MTFLPPLKLRQYIATPTQDRVDFRAACFCHKKIVDIGFVCSVCLSSELSYLSRGVVKSFRLLMITQFFASLSPSAQLAGKLVSGIGAYSFYTHCRTKFPMKTLQRLNNSRLPAIHTNGTTKPKNGLQSTLK